MGINPGHFYESRKFRGSRAPAGLVGRMFSWVRALVDQFLFLWIKTTISLVEIFSRGKKFFLRVEIFSLGPKFFHVGRIFLLVSQFFCRGWKTSSVLFSCLNFFGRSKFCFRGITQVFSIDHDQTKLLGKLGVLVSKKLGMIGNHGK